MLRNNSNILHTDAVVIGTGILGLMLAKRLVDFGQSVVLIDRSLTIANGASSMNHGWIHQGSAPSLTADDPDHAAGIVKKLQYGHDFFKSYAPECFDEPFEHSYAATNDPAKAAHARTTWTRSGINFRELSSAEFRAVEPDFNPALARYFFEVPESRINNRLLFMKLLTEIRKKGGLVFLGAEYAYDDEHTIRLTNPEGERRVSSPIFLYATGTQLGHAYEKFTGTSLGMQHCKSHLLYLPKMVGASVIGLDHGAPIIFNHGDISIINRSYDETPVDSSDDYEVNLAEVEKSLQILSEYYPATSGLRATSVNAKAFLKPYLMTAKGSGRHSAGHTILEPSPGHIFALPGKMTAAPFVADQIIGQIAPLLHSSDVTGRPFDAASPRMLAHAGA